ncbi:MAG: hypothetical protein AAGD32_04735, partial [Planctomycetota bacterium]
GLDGSSYGGLSNALDEGLTLYSYDQRGHGAAADQPPRDVDPLLEVARRLIRGRAVAALVVGVQR